MQFVSVMPGERIDVALSTGIEELPERPPVPAFVADTPQRGQRAALQIVDLPWLVQHLGIGKRDAAAVGALGIGADDLFQYTIEIMDLDRVIHLPYGGRDHQRPQVWSVSGFIRADDIEHG